MLFAQRARNCGAIRLAKTQLYSVASAFAIKIIINGCRAKLTSRDGRQASPIYQLWSAGRCLRFLAPFGSPSWTAAASSRRTGSRICLLCHVDSLVDLAQPFPLCIMSPTVYSIRNRLSLFNLQADNKVSLRFCFSNYRLPFLFLSICIHNVVTQ